MMNQKHATIQNWTAAIVDAITMAKSNKCPTCGTLVIQHTNGIMNTFYCPTCCQHTCISIGIGEDMSYQEHMKFTREFNMEQL